MQLLTTLKNHNVSLPVYLSKMLSTVLTMLDFWSHSASKKIENEEKEEDKKTKRKAKASKLFIGVRAKEQNMAWIILTYLRLLMPRNVLFISSIKS